MENLIQVDKDSDSNFQVSEDDPEVKNKVRVNFVSQATHTIFTRLTGRLSCWNKLKRVVATVMKWLPDRKEIGVEDIEAAETDIIRLVQKDLERSVNSKSVALTKKNTLAVLDPFLDKKGIIRVGGRLTNSLFSIDIMHPVILPKDHQVTTILVRWYHERINHCRRGITLIKLEEDFGLSRQTH